MTELRNAERELARFRLRLVGGGGCSCWSRSALLARAPRLPAGRPARRAIDAGREQPHRGRADRAQPRPDPRPQRRRARQQLLGLHARDHAVEGAATSTRRSTQLAEVVDDPAARPQALQAAARGEQELRDAADPHRLTDEEVARFAAQRYRFPGVEIKARLFRQLPARRGRQPRDRLHRPHQPGREGAIDDWPRTSRQLPRHRLHRQARRRAELRDASCTARPASRRSRSSAGGRAVRALSRNPATPGNNLRAVDRHPAAGDGRAAVRRPPRRAGRDRPAQRRGAGVRQQAELRPEPVRRRHRRRELERAQRIARQAAAQPRAARHLSAGLDLQAVHGAGRADARQAHAAAGDLATPATSTSATTASATTRTAATARSTCTSRSWCRATPTTTCSPTTSASTRCTTSWRRSASASITGIDMEGELRGMLPSTEWKRKRLPQEGAAEVVRRRDDLARHRPGLQHVHACCSSRRRRRRSPTAA